MKPEMRVHTLRGIVYEFAKGDTLVRRLCPDQDSLGWSPLDGLWMWCHGVERRCLGEPLVFLWATDPSERASRRVTYPVTCVEHLG